MAYTTPLVINALGGRHTHTYRRVVRPHVPGLKTYQKIIHLAKMTHRFLYIPASSSLVERLFSIAGKVFYPDQCCLTDKRFEELML